MPRRPYLTEDEQQRLIEAAAQSRNPARDRFFVHLMCRHGLTIDQLIFLVVYQLDFERRRLCHRPWGFTETLRANLTELGVATMNEVGMCVYFKATPLTDLDFNLYDAWRRERISRHISPAMVRYYNCAIHYNDFVFVGRDGDFLTRSGGWRILLAAAKRAGLGPLSTPLVRRPPMLPPLKRWTYGVKPRIWWREPNGPH